MNTRPIVAFSALAALVSLPHSIACADPLRSESTLDRGRYLVRMGGCNDCHTPGYPQSDGTTPEKQWLIGSSVGFQGPWGTSYPANLRLVVQGLTESEWIARCRQPLRPPMPWFNLKAMSDDDLAAMYRFIKSLGPAGEPAPVAAGPGEAVMTPYIEFVPKNLPAVAGR